MGITFEVWGDTALFTRLEMKVERVSYDVITPSAARAIIESIHWKPAIRWHIDRITVCNPIKFANVRRNEVSSKISADNVATVMRAGKGALYIAASDDIQQRASMVLKDVRYVIDAHFTLTDKAGESDTEEKHYAIVMRRLRNGQCFQQPCFGCREFPAQFKLREGDMPLLHYADEPDMDLGYMLYDVDYSDPEDYKPMFFRAVMSRGVIDVANSEVVS